MKKLLLATLLLSAPAMAAEKRTVEDCQTITDIAGVVMENRQAGVEMIEMYKVAENKLVRTIIKDAFNVPKYNSEKYQQQEITKFKNAWFKACID